jgi:hypothetical protein
MADIETIVVVRPPARGRYGDPVPGSAAEFEVGGCQFAPGPSTEAGINANTVEAEATVYAPPNVDIRAADQVRARGELWVVFGAPQFWGSFGTVIPLRRATG